MQWHFQPIGVTDNNTVELHNEDILVIIDPNEKIKKLYHKMLQQFELMNVQFDENLNYDDENNINNDDDEDDSSESLQKEKQSIKKYLH